MKVNFTKMQACGNDYIYFNCFDAHTRITAPQTLSLRLSRRRFGVGGDGIVLMLPSDVADAKMRIFNRDGSEGKMCGNAIRCVAKYLYENKIVTKTDMGIETLSGIKKLSLITAQGFVSAVEVDMGQAILEPGKIPVQLAGEAVIAQPVEINGQVYEITCVSMGNPHAVVFCADVEAWRLAETGPLFEHSPLFPDRVNLEIAEMLSRSHIKMRVWERGSGETLACGTGACACAVAAILNGHCDRDTDITVAMPGGALTIRCTDETIYMTGGCEKIFDGVVAI
ncbi:MAG: diaminopimelate epimerase [Defluviitaleaceae bacterium]|nr:diaminopimelate epimerase [Defluviitaleaceae bacterium]MCL2239304.1 diaminopimelate epimerase [Defluviitaleaceae bacterium]